MICLAPRRGALGAFPYTDTVIWAIACGRLPSTPWVVWRSSSKTV